jgi:hypothetical protein
MKKAIMSFLVLSIVSAFAGAQSEELSSCMLQVSSSGAPQPLDPSARCPACGSYSTSRYCDGLHDIQQVWHLVYYLVCQAMQHNYNTHLHCYACGYDNRYYGLHPHIITHPLVWCPGYPSYYACPY